MTHQVLETRSGVLEFDVSGYPTKETVAKVFYEMDFHGAMQAYLSATAILVTGPVPSPSARNARRMCPKQTLSTATRMKVGLPTFGSMRPLKPTLTRAGN